MANTGESEDDLRRYAQAAGIAVSAGLVLDRRGLRHDVLLDAAGGRVWRFPRFAVDVPRLARTAAIATAVHELGLPAPRVLDCLADGGVGHAHLVLSYVPGIALDDPRVRALPPRCRERIGRDLAGVLVRMRHLPRDVWPITETPWPDLWADMAARARATVLRLLPTDVAARMAAALDRAVDVAAAAPAGLVHGDLGGVNVRLDPASGALTGIIDWDGAVPGDPAVDVAAVRALGVPGVNEAMLAAEPGLAAELDRFAAYLPTWALQEALWGVEHADPDLLADGLSRVLAEAG